MPIPRPGEVLGLVGTNGIGKSTALKILAGKQKPNLGKFDVSLKTSCCLPPTEHKSEAVTLLGFESTQYKAVLC